MASENNNQTKSKHFVGRRAELDVIERLIPRTVHSGGWTVMITGPGGIGKTRLASEASHLSADTQTIWGRCSDEARSTPFWPWVQVIRRLQDGAGAGTDLARLVLGGPAEGDRLELFEATASLIEDRAADAPLIIVLDDLHLADASSLLLTRFLGRRLRESAVLMLATHRPIGGLDPEQAGRVEALSNASVVIELIGLDADEIATVLTTSLPIQDILVATGGNPLLVQHAISGGRSATELDTRLGDILGQRIASMPPSTRRVIAGLAVIGAGWTITDLAHIVEMPPAELTAALDRGHSADLIAAVDDTVEVAHALVAQAGAIELDDQQRARLHRRAGELLNPTDHPTERAAHLLQGGPTVLAEALDAVQQCAEQALAVLAPESTVGLLRTALDCLDGSAALRDTDTEWRARRRFDLLALLGDATWRSGQRDQAAEAFDAARLIGLELADAPRVARATLGGGVQYDFHGARTEEITKRLRAVLVDFRDDTDPLRARLLAMLAMKLMPIDPTAARTIALDSVQAADTAGDQIALGHAMIADQITLLGPSTLNRRIDSAHKILAIGHDYNHPDLLVQGRFLLLGALLERGDIRALDAELATQERTLEELADETLVRHSLWFRCTRALLRGAIEEGEQLAEDCFAVALRLGDPDGIGVYGGQITLIRWMQGLLLETEQLYLDLQTEEPNDPLWPAILGSMWTMDGQLDAARGALDILPPLDEIEESQHWLLTMCAIAEAAAIAGTDEQRLAVREVLLPYADRVVPVAMGASLWGTIARPLGLLARSLGLHADAVEHLRDAIDIAARLGAWPWLIEAQIDLAVTLVEHDDQGDEVVRLLDEASRASERLGLGQFVERSKAVILSLPLTMGGPARDGANDVDLRVPAVVTPATGRVVVTVCGGFDVVLPTGPAQWPSRKSRMLLRVLIAQRGQSIHRERLADRLWPDDPRGASRLDVEVSRLRRALDPERTSDRDEFVVVREGTLRLQTERFDIDIENILDVAERVGADPDSIDTTELGTLCARHSGAAFAEDAYADWASPVRDATNTAICVLLRTLAERQMADGRPVAAASSLRSILAIDEYDTGAHRALIATLESSGSHGLAAAAADQFAAAMDDLGVDIASLGVSR